MPFSIDQDTCMKCGICVNICPDGVKLENGNFIVYNQDADCLEEAMDNCPSGALHNDEE
ncbi:MAG: ferredoxin [Promethearchaeota archaeon]